MNAQLEPKEKILKTDSRKRVILGKTACPVYLARYQPNGEILLIPCMPVREAKRNG